MKKTALIFYLIAAISLISLGCSSKIQTINVNDLAADPTAFKGEIAVKAVVQNVEKDKFTITLIDEQEYKTCGIIPCGGARLIPVYLPDSSNPLPSGHYFEGQFPKVEDTVTVIGKIITGDQGFFFEVSKIHKDSATIISKTKS